MPEPVSVERLKQQLRLDAAASVEDGLLADLIVSARRTVENITFQTIVGEEQTLPEADMPQAAQAILLLASYWYDNRDGSSDVPPAVEALARPLRRWGE